MTERVQDFRQHALVWLGLSGFLLSWVVSPDRGIPVHSTAAWPRIALTTPISGLDLPVHILHASDGSGRLFVVEQRGRVRIVKGGVLHSTPFLDISDRVSCCGERGLLSIAFPPDYASKRRFYAYYTDRNGDTVVARYAVTEDPDVADAASEQIVLSVAQPYANHNGGQLAFGPRDGYLYVGLGDGGSAGDPENRAQNPDSLLGKLLRIDVEGGLPLTYTVPANNPYVQTSGYRPEIWALGLRNPWRFSFDVGTGDLYIGDVGQNRYEEIDYQPASSTGGENYGWRIMEGAHCFDPPDCDPDGLVLPVAEYQHSAETCSSVTGGTVYRGDAIPDLNGIYLHADYCDGRIWGLESVGSSWRHELLHDAPFRISSFGLDEGGELWLARYDAAPAGAIYQLAEGEVIYLPLVPGARSSLMLLH